MTFAPLNLEAIFFVAMLIVIAIICGILAIGWLWMRVVERSEDRWWEFHDEEADF